MILRCGGSTFFNILDYRFIQVRRGQLEAYQEAQVATNQLIAAINEELGN